MRASETETTLRLVFTFLPAFLWLPLSSAVLSGYQNRYITEDRRFGCNWSGGGASGGVSCRCTEDAEEMFIGPNSINSFDTSSIEILDCKTVRFGKKAIEDMRNLRHIHLSGISDLDFEESALSWFGYRDREQYEERFGDLSVPSLEIVIENSNINKISSYTFQGRINTISLRNVTVQSIEAFAFNSLMQSEKISIRDSSLHNLKLQSFKKFSTENVEFDGVKTDLIPSRFFSNVRIHQNFLIANSDIETVRPGGFVVDGPQKFEVSNTRINQLDGEAFKVTTSNDVVFRNNTFNIINDGAFRGLALDRDSVFHDLTIYFDSNVFTELTRDSLAVPDGFEAKFANVKIREVCDCRNIDKKIKDVAFYDEIQCLHSDEFVTIKEFKVNMCSVVQSYSTVIIIVAVVFTLCFIICVVMYVYYRRVYLSRKYGKDEKSTKNGGNLSLIVPDGRTYRETELHVIVERADLLTTDL